MGKPLIVGSSTQFAVRVRVLLFDQIRTVWNIRQLELDKTSQSLTVRFFIRIDLTIDGHSYVWELLRDVMEIEAVDERLFELWIPKNWFLRSLTNYKSSTEDSTDRSSTYNSIGAFHYVEPVGRIATVRRIDSSITILLNNTSRGSKKDIQGTFTIYSALIQACELRLFFRFSYLYYGKHCLLKASIWHYYRSEYCIELL